MYPWVARLTTYYESIMSTLILSYMEVPGLQNLLSDITVCHTVDSAKVFWFHTPGPSSEALVEASLPLIFCKCCNCEACSVTIHCSVTPAAIIRAVEREQYHLYHLHLSTFLSRGGKFLSDTTLFVPEKVLYHFLS